MVKKLLILSTVFIAGCSMLFFAVSLKYTFITVHGYSMYPTYDNGDVLMLKKEKTFTRDQIIVFHLPEAWEDEYLGDPDIALIKRIRAVPGDKIIWDGEGWSLNGEVFSYLKTGSCPIEPKEFTLGPGELFVTGDTSIGKTLDSREAFCKGLPFLVKDNDVEAFGTIKKIFKTS